jgi:penicillin-insensitive murein endopeptidase
VRPADRDSPLPSTEPESRSEAEPALVAPPISAPQKALDPSASTSIGTPGDGRLEGGVPLPMQGKGFRFNDRRSSDARYATAEVIAAIMRAARVVDTALPGSELVVNDISLPQGGPIDHHGSHRVGRDADILFYMLGDDGGPTPSVGAPLDPDGVGFDFKDLSVGEDDVRVRLDAQRTWLFVAALLDDPGAEVQRIFVAEHLRSMLLAEAERSGADKAIVQRFADITCQPSYPHDDHLHVRWFCSAEDLGKGCLDLPPLYPWQRQSLLSAGVEPAMGALSKKRPKSKIVTHEEEDREVAKLVLHRDVKKFLARRKIWREQPHPGRQYCR